MKDEFVNSQAGVGRIGRDGGTGLFNDLVTRRGPLRSSPTNPAKKPNKFAKIQANPG
jgi:hypothetical protein